VRRVSALGVLALGLLAQARWCLRAYPGSELMNVLRSSLGQRRVGVDPLRGRLRTDPASPANQAWPRSSKSSADGLEIPERRSLR
jgi:hypothetical protein